ncbi:hypothetical protein EZS27_029213 [termite gut metagenome]|jgi:hypothetical protein|uniref:Uncharacterized protein n=1 Tax=termite gut metagenome TaxID=433724 RepID=A0A5J4QIH4_9ZZZZ
MKKLFEMNKILCVLSYLFLVLTIIALIVFVFQLHDMFCYYEGSTFYDLFYNWHFLKFLLIACFSILTLYVAGSQLQKQTDMNCINALVELRKQLTSGCNRDVHFRLLPEQEQRNLPEQESATDNKEYNITPFEKIPMIDIFNYLGTIELGALMVEKELIDMKTFENQMGYRVENIFNGTTDAQIKVRQHIQNERAYYDSLLWIKRKMNL